MKLFVFFHGFDCCPTDRRFLYAFCGNPVLNSLPIKDDHWTIVGISTSADTAQRHRRNFLENNAYSSVGILNGSQFLLALLGVASVEGGGDIAQHL